MKVVHPPEDGYPSKY